MTVRTLRIASCFAALLLAAPGCDIDIDVTDTGGDGPADDGAEDMGEDGAEDMGEDGAEEGGESGTEDGGEESEGGDDGPIGPGCDPLAQDCPEGDGCYGIDGDFACAPVADPGQAGDACEFINTCDVGLQCVTGDAVSGCNDVGCCTPFCDLAGGACDEPDAECVPYFEEGAAPPGHENVGLCLDGDGGDDDGGDDEGGDDGGGGPIECDPLAQDCPAGDGCYGSTDSFVCAPVVEPGQAGDECEFLNVCDVGLQCVNADAYPGCVGEGCCTPFCDTTQGDGCEAPGTECIPYFEEGTSPPGLESVGLCVSL